jgi:hypothetical protein
MTAHLSFNCFEAHKAWQKRRIIHSPGYEIAAFYESAT